MTREGEMVSKKCVCELEIVVIEVRQVGVSRVCAYLYVDVRRFVSALPHDVGEGCQ